MEWWYILILSILSIAVIFLAVENYRLRTKNKKLLELLVDYDEMCDRWRSVARDMEKIIDPDSKKSIP